MSRKICEECRVGFEPSRKTQRFCSTRCGDRQRDRRRRQQNQKERDDGGSASAANSPCPEKVARTPELALERPATRQRLDATIKTHQQTIDALQTKLRSQSGDIDRLEAENAERQSRISLLQGEVARLKRAQRINVQDLAHVAARLVAMAQAKGLPLDPKTRDILRSRGWIPSKRPAGVRRL
jgi:hypothetical protein